MVGKHTHRESWSWLSHQYVTNMVSVPSYLSELLTYRLDCQFGARVTRDLGAAAAAAGLCTLPTKSAGGRQTIPATYSTSTRWLRTRTASLVCNQHTHTHTGCQTSWIAIQPASQPARTIERFFATSADYSFVGRWYHGAETSTSLEHSFLHVSEWATSICNFLALPFTCSRTHTHRNSI